jgi:hypothetical protein
MFIGITRIALLITVLGACSCSRREDQLEVSLQRLADNYLPAYEIVRASKNNSLTDVGGEWQVRLKANQRAIALPKSSFERADQEDLKFFKKTLIRNKLLANENGAFELYRAELRLGEGSSCDPTECSVYVLHENGASLVYIGIYKN